MRIKSVASVMFIGLMISSFLCTLHTIDWELVRGQAVTANRDPILLEANLYICDENAYFSVIYRDPDGDPGSVTLYLDNEPHNMDTLDDDPIEGQYFEEEILESAVEDNMEFYFYADDNNGSTTYLNSEYGVPFLIGDFLGWGEPPVLSNPDIYLDGNYWVFNVTYQDPEGHEASWLDVNIDDEYAYTMETTDPDPFIGQNYRVSIPQGIADENTQFYFDTQDINNSCAYLYDEEGDYFVIGDFLGDEDADDDDGIGWGLPAGWDDPEVIVGLLALVGMAGAGGYGLYRKKKKRGRFSELLTRLDDVYRSFKTNPHKCEIELEKVRGIINEDLKHSIIDENNYNILKDRIDEIMSEIRSESLLTEVRDLPKDIEIRIKDMLIDGKITRAEYDKLLPIIKGSDMASGDKEKMEKTLESWVEKDKKSGK